MQSSESGAVVSAPAERSWSLPRRLVFRFAFAYFVIFGWFGMFFPLQPIQIVTQFLVQWNGWLRTQHDAAWGWYFGHYQHVVTWWNSVVADFGERFLGLVETVDVSRSGSGDKIEDLNQLVFVGVVALGVAILWSLFSRKRSHPQLAHLLWIAARIFLAGVMLSYGFAKVIKTQFSEPSLIALTTPLGDLAPMTLVWTFMGFSTPYTIFAGLGEVVGGVLLAFRRTATLGAMVSFGVMINVTMLNYSYDVPVKFYATYYTLLAALITLPDARRLLDVLVLQRAVPARSLAGPTRLPWFNHLVSLLTVIWIFAFSRISIDHGLDVYRQFGDGRIKPALYGVYEVTSFVRNGEVVPPRLDDGTRWLRLVIEQPTTVTIQCTNGTFLHCPAEYRSPESIGLSPPPSFSFVRDRFPRFMAALDSRFPQPLPTFTLREIAPKRYVLSGEFQGNQVEVTMTRRLREDFELTGRGFHWLNPVPYHGRRRG